MATSRDEKQLRAAWEGWHTISPPMRKDYQRFVELSNKGAQELGFADTGAMWRAKYDMPPDAFTTELDRLWDQVRPLYLKLHAYVRMKLRAEVRRRRAGERPDSGAPARQHLGAGLDEHLSARRAGERRSRLLAHRHSEERERSTPLEMVRDRRALLHVARLRAAAEDVLGALAVRAPARPRRRLPRQRLGHRRSQTTCASRCASSRRPRTSRRSITSSATTSISAPTRISRCSSATARTTASTRRSATRSRSRSRRNTS